ncbi:MAG TPA: DUF6798 domain-containing protein, partial [Phycisphaerae bacterium]|nr:DUF6798 domain-containing protein [Phycisphaerae bacterium]
MGNQGIQIAFLEKLHDNELFKNDVMVNETLRAYPSFFFHIVARLLVFTDLPTLYLLLHVAATTGVFAAVIALSTGITRNKWTGLACALFLLASRHQALAGEALYSTGFTHTWAIFPLSLFALYLFYKDRHIAAFLLAGLIFNFHALEAAHLLAIMGFAALFEIRAIGIGKLAAAVGAFVVFALPTVLVIVSQSQKGAFDFHWLELMYIRSADHSFPFTWWQNANPDVPKFLGVLALAALGLGFRLPRRMKRKTLLLVGGIGLLFVAGTLFTEVWHVPVFIRAQLFRSSRLLFILSLILIANGCVKAWSLPWKRPAGMPAWAAWLEFACATFTACCLIFPGVLPFVPYAIVFGLIVALVTGRLAWYETLTAGVSLIVTVLASQTISFAIPGIQVLGPGNRHLLGAINWGSILQNNWPPPYAWLIAIAALGLAAVACLRLRKGIQSTIVACGAVVGVIAFITLFPVLKRSGEGDPAWADVQRWIQEHTPKTARILTPPTDSGFRILSQRSIVGEYRDGTQLYFKGAFAKDLWDIMKTVQPGRVINADHKSLLNYGKNLETLDDEEIIALA